MALVIPVFIPHEGCPHRCLFCNQHRLGGHQAVAPVGGDEVAATIDLWLGRCRPERLHQVQVAFYGGSFTCLAPERQLELLAPVQSFLERGQVQEIRLSTRPDGIDAPTLDRLARHRVTTIELGVQSCDDAVLARAVRGHDSAAVIRAARLVRARGFRLGIQLLPGLPGENFASLRRTTATVIGLRPDFVRIYPTLVLEDSGLARLYHRGGYRPLTLGRAVALVAWMKKRFDAGGIEVVRMGLQPDFVRIYPTLVLEDSGLARLYHRGGYRPLSLGRAVAQVAWMKKRFDAGGIQVVRMGLQPTGALERALVAGPYHPAFGELVLGRLMLRQARRLLAAAATDGPVTLVMAARDRSIFQGQRSVNLHRLRQLGLAHNLVVRTDADQERQTVRMVAA